MKKCFFIAFTIIFNIKAMEEITARFNEVQSDLTPLQKAVITDDIETVERILRPNSVGNQNMLMRLRNGMEYITTHRPTYNVIQSLITRGPTPAELCDQITQPIPLSLHSRFGSKIEYRGYESDTLLHLAAGKCSFRVLKRRYVPGTGYNPFKNELDERNLEECGLYHPYNKSAVLRALLDYLPAAKVAQAVNKPGLYGMTPLHYGMISALVFTKNSYNGLLLEEHRETITLLMTRGANRLIEVGKIPMPTLIRNPGGLQQCLWDRDAHSDRYPGGHPLSILQLYRDLAFWNSSGIPYIAEDRSWEVDENILKQISKTVDILKAESQCVQFPFQDDRA
jgi:hypothetical protein